MNQHGYYPITYIGCTIGVRVKYSIGRAQKQLSEQK